MPWPPAYITPRGGILVRMVAKLRNGRNGRSGKLSHSSDVIGACICSNYRAGASNF